MVAAMEAGKFWIAVWAAWVNLVMMPGTWADPPPSSSPPMEIGRPRKLPTPWIRP
jgi:hypothetical protein